MSDLYLKDNYINDNIPYMFNRSIIEYDMKDAGFSLTKEFNLLPFEVIESLDKMDKNERKIKIGKIQIKNREYAKKLIQSFGVARGMFFEDNNIEDEEVVSIKKDAIFVTKKCNVQKFGKYINFRPKNEYTSYIHLEDKIEIYYSPIKTDVKGLGVDKELSQNRQELHDDFIMQVINTFCRKMETEEVKHVLQYLRIYIDKYRKGELEIGCYRTFDNRSVFITTEDGEIDKTYNLIHVLTKLAQIPI